MNEQLIKPPMHPPIESGEQRIPYVHRIRSLNHYNKLTWLWPSHLELKAIPSAKRIEQAIENTSWCMTEKQHPFTHEIRRLNKNYKIRNSKYCPRCLEDNGLWNEWWTIKLVDVCIEHQVWLLDDCHQCGKPITWEPHRKGYCKCDPTIHANANSESAPYLAYILNIFIILDKSHREEVGELPETTELSLNQRLDLISDLRTVESGFFMNSKPLDRKASTTQIAYAMFGSRSDTMAFFNKIFVSETGYSLDELESLSESAVIDVIIKIRQSHCAMIREYIFARTIELYSQVYKDVKDTCFNAMFVDTSQIEPLKGL